MVLDTHTHAWGAPSPEYPWVNGPMIEERVAVFDTPLVYDADALLDDMDRAGVDEAVVVGYPINDWRDNAYTERVAAEHNRLHGVVMLDPFAEDAAETLRESMATDGVVGFRLGAICPYDAMWREMDPAVDWLTEAAEETAFWAAAEETDALVQILAHRDQLDQAQALVDRYPDLSYAFDHLGHPDPSVPPAEDEGFSRFGELAANENVAVKITELPHWSTEGFPYRDVFEHVEYLIEAFGPERVFWGSDYPNVSDDADYVETLTWLDQLGTLSDRDWEYVTDRAFREHVGL